ncbi:MAG: pyridoxamine kinase [archaeon]|nr:pyridoxamine kinase [archaeon]
MNDRQRKVLAIHDISCMGKCSLTVAIPIISATGLEVPVLPTAVLSTQTSGFEGYSFRDLTDDMVLTLEHWKSLGVTFDGIYTGFLGSDRQIDIVCRIIDELAPEAKVFIDPVMGDDGKLYDIFGEDFPDKMKKLVSRADFISPNITEAMLLLGKEYPTGPLSRRFVESTLRELSALGPRKVILTGVYFDRYNLGAASYDADTDEISYYFSKRIPGTYYGTGDIFCSTTVAGIMNGLPMAKALSVAVDFTQRSIERTYAARTDVRYGVNFEEGIPKMLDDMSLGHLSYKI